MATHLRDGLYGRLSDSGIATTIAVVLAVCFSLIHSASSASQTTYPTSCLPSPMPTFTTGPLSLQGGSSTGRGWGTSCNNSVTADFKLRDGVLASWNAGSRCYGGSTYGPQPPAFAAAPTVPATCSLTTWFQTRVLSVIAKIVGYGFNYCHHHVPTWLPPNTPSMRGICVGPDGKTYSPQLDLAPNCTCSMMGMQAGAYTKLPFQGVDCSNYVSWVYNYGFGLVYNGEVGQLACNAAPGGGAIGGILPINASNPSEQPGLLPGDLLFIRATTTSSQVNHVVIWTGYTVNFTATTGPFSVATLLNHTDSNDLTDTKNALAQAKASKTTVYVISDSHNAGPSYRPFVGWYTAAFSHARRAFNANGLPLTASFLSYDKNTGYCYNTRFGAAS